MTEVFVVASQEALAQKLVESTSDVEVVDAFDPTLLDARVIVIYGPGLDIPRTVLICSLLSPDRLIVVGDESDLKLATDAANALDAVIEVIPLDDFDLREVSLDVPEQAFRMLVQDVSGETVVGHRLSGLPMDQERVQPATSGSGGQCSVIASKIDGNTVTVTLEKPDHLFSPGMVMSRVGELPELSDQFKADLVWLGADDGFEGRGYDLVISGQQSPATISEIKHRYDPHSFQYLSARKISVGDCVSVTLGLADEVAFTTASASRALATFTLRDRYSEKIVAMGVLSHSLRRAQNVHRQQLSITRSDRELMGGHGGAVIWFTGLSGSGKSTVANGVEQALHERGVRTYILDGDNVRHGLNKDLGFTDADRVENIRRVAEVARLMVDAGLVVLTSFISPFRSERDLARQLFADGEFFEVYVNVPLSVAEERDPKGLYRKARAGEIPNFTGIDSDYEPPSEPELEVRTDEVPLTECVRMVCDLLDRRVERQT